MGDHMDLLKLVCCPPITREEVVGEEQALQNLVWLMTSKLLHLLEPQSVDQRAKCQQCGLIYTFRARQHIYKLQCMHCKGSARGEKVVMSARFC